MMHVLVLLHVQIICLIYYFLTMSIHNGKKIDVSTLFSHIQSVNIRQSLQVWLPDGDISVTMVTKGIIWLLGSSWWLQSYFGCNEDSSPWQPQETSVTIATRKILWFPWQPWGYFDCYGYHGNYEDTATKFSSTNFQLPHQEPGQNFQIQI